MKTPSDKLAERERREKLRRLSAEMGSTEREQFALGTFGCHEMLDRVLLVGDNVEQHVLDHPACLHDPGWYALANQAVWALRELYQRVGAAHLQEDSTPFIPNRPTRRKRTG